jgi:SAM-dependent methyltransferase
MTSSRRSHGADQALGYLAAMREELGLEEAFTAVVTDGRQWGFLASDLPGRQLSLLEPDVPPDRRFQWRLNSPAACRRFLVLLGSNRQRAVTASGLATAFGPNTRSARKIVTLLVELLASRQTDDRADTLYNEWRRSVEVVYGNLDDEQGRLALRIREAFDVGVRRGLGELLFAVQSYFALVVRLAAIEVLAIATQDPDSQPTTWSSLADDQLVERLRAIDEGEIPRGLEIQNLFESDVFSWYLDALLGNVDLLNGIRETLDALQEFALPRVAYGAARGTDVLRDLYRVLVPRELRKALGEFTTPTWLAQACIERLQDLGASLESGRVLDPTCGTGTFLLPILKSRLGRLRAESGEFVSQDDVTAVLNGVVGFDINPIAVTAARANYALALGDLATGGPITLPVWRADSILLPDEAPLQTTTDSPRLIGHSWQALHTSLPDPFPIPTPLATAERMARLRAIIEDSLLELNADQSRLRFIAGLEAAFGAEGDQPLASGDGDWIGVREVATELHDRIRELRDSQRNGVWARIIENNFAPVFAGQFDVVVGNPPWLTWSKTPSSWRRAGEMVWKRYGLWRVPREGRRASGTIASGDMAILVFALALQRYAVPGGMVGLLAPRSLVNADPGGRAFRQFHLKPAAEDVAAVGRGSDLAFRIVGIDDWGEIKPFAPDAANSPVFIAARSNERHVFPVPTTRWERSQPGAKLGVEWAEARASLRPILGTSNPVDPGVPTSAWSFHVSGSPPLLEGGTNRWAFGTGLHTRGANGIFFVRLIDTDKQRGRALIENSPDAGRNPAVQARRGWVELALVQPLLRGRDVRAWTAEPSGHILLPYDPESLGDMYDEDQLRDHYPETWRWLRSHAQVLQERKPPPTRSWDVRGKDWYRLEGPLSHMGFGNIVVVREQQQRPAAAVVPVRYDERLGRTAPPLIDHKLAFCSVDSPDEAVYLACVINSTPFQDLLASFSNVIAIAPQTLRRLPIPDFEPNVHRSVVEAGRTAFGAASTGGRIDQAEVDRAVLSALGMEGYEAQPIHEPHLPHPVTPAAKALPGLTVDT